MHHANGCALFKWLTGTAVNQLALTITGKSGFNKLGTDCFV